MSWEHEEKDKFTMTTKNELRDWFDRGVEQGAEFMIIFCDTFSYDDYPVYTTDEQEFTDAMNSNDRLMEVYDLAKDMEEQMKLGRCFNYPKWYKDAVF